MSPLTNILKSLTFTALAAALISCEKQPTSSTTYITNHEPPNQGVETELESHSEILPKHPELESIKGKHSSGKIYLRYTINTNEMKKWTILAPFEVKIHQHYIELGFSGNYYIDGEPTGNGAKKLFIKKQDIKTILVTE